MAHFAELDSQNIVKRVIVISDENCKIDNVENETAGINYCKSLYGSNTTWKQTKQGGFRHIHAGVGYSYNSDDDVFIKPSPYASWILNSNHEWEPPVRFDSSLGTAVESGIPFDQNEQFIATTLGPNRRGIYIWDESVYQSDNTLGWVLIDQTPTEADSVRPDDN
jgi:hypothetical protein